MKQTIVLFMSTLLFLSLLLFTGCANVVKKSYPERNYYIFHVSRQGETHAPVGTVLEIRKTRISPRYEGKKFVYRKGELKYESDFYNQFFKSPDSLISEEVWRWFSESGLFELVVDSASNLESSYILQGIVTVLYGDYSDNRTPRAVLEMQFLLTHDISAHSDIVFQKKYREEIPMKGASPDDLIKGWSKALQQILTDVENDLRVKAIKVKS